MIKLFFATLILFTNSAFACSELLTSVEISRPKYLGYLGVRHGSLNGIPLTHYNSKPYNFGTGEVTVVDDRRSGPEGLVAIRSYGNYSKVLGLFDQSGKLVFETKPPRHFKFGRTEFKWKDMTANVFYSYGSLAYFDPQTHRLTEVSLRGSSSYEHLIFPVVRLKQGFLVVRWQSEYSAKLQFSLYSETGKLLTELYSYEKSEHEFSNLDPEQFFEIASDGTLTFLTNSVSRHQVNLHRLGMDGKITRTRIDRPSSGLKVFFND